MTRSAPIVAVSTIPRRPPAASSADRSPVLPAIVLGVLALLALGLVIERALEARAPIVAGRRLGELLGLPVEVVAGGRGRDWVRHRTVSVVALTAHHVPIRDGVAELARIDVQLRKVSWEGRGSGRRVMAEAGDFTARIEQSELQKLVDLPPLVRRLEVRNEHLRLITTGGLAVDLRVTAEDHAIVLAPVANPLPKVLPMRWRVPLEELPAGARIQRAVVRDGAVVASGPLDGARLHGAPPA